MFEKILPSAIEDVVKRFATNNRFSFFTQAIDPNARAYRELIKSKEYQDLLDGFLATETTIPRCSHNFKTGGTIEEADSEVRYTHTIARKLTEIHKKNCNDEVQAGSFCNEIGSMIDVFNEFASDDRYRSNEDDMNNGDWHVRSPTTSRYDLSPVDQRPQWKPGL